MIGFTGQMSATDTHTKRGTCNFYSTHGYCKFGDNCRYAHLPKNVSNDVKKPCNFYSTHGYCKFGDNCRYTHVQKTEHNANEDDLKKQKTTDLKLNAPVFEPHNRFMALTDEPEESAKCNERWMNIPKTVMKEKAYKMQQKWIRQKGMVVIWRDWTKINQD